MRMFFVFALLAGCGAPVPASDAATDSSSDASDAPLTRLGRACRGLDIPGRLEPYDSCQSQPGGGGLINCSSTVVSCSRYLLHQDHPPVASCTRSCGADADCPSGGICLRVMPRAFESIGFCFRPCSVEEQCSQGATCRAAGLNSDPRRVCVPYETCSGTGFVLPDGGV